MSYSLDRTNAVVGLDHIGISWLFDIITHHTASFKCIAADHNDPYHPVTNDIMKRYIVTQGLWFSLSSATHAHHQLV